MSSRKTCNSLLFVFVAALPAFIASAYAQPAAPQDGKNPKTTKAQGSGDPAAQKVAPGPKTTKGVENPTTAQSYKYAPSDPSKAKNPPPGLAPSDPSKSKNAQSLKQAPSDPSKAKNVKSADGSVTKY